MLEYRGIIQRSPVPTSSSSSSSTSAPAAIPQTPTFSADLLAAVTLSHIFHATGGFIYRTQISPSFLSSAASSSPDPSSVQLGSLESTPVFSFEPAQGVLETVVARLYGPDNTAVLAGVTQKGEAVVGSFREGDQFDIQAKISSPKGWNLEAGWAGIDLNPSNQSQGILARHYQRSVAIYDSETLVRKFATSQMPCQVKYVPKEILNSHSEGIGVVEGNELTLWDQRMGEKYGCIKRLSPALGPLYAADFTNSSVGATGYDRNIFVFDPRKWAIKGSWSSCVKYEATSMLFSNKDESLTFVSGSMDSEIGFGKWVKGGNSTEKRCDGRVVGMAQTSIGDNLIAITSAGSLYLFSEASHLANQEGEAHEGHQSKRFRSDLDLLEKK